MRRIPFILGLVFIAVTTSRIADFAGGDLRAWIMSLALTGSVFASAYYMDFKTTFKRSVVVLIILAILDTTFNLGDTLKWSVETGRWDFVLKFSNGTGLYIYQIADIIYGIFPTIAAVLMAYLSKGVERIPVSSKKGTWKDRLIEGVTNWVLGSIEQTHVHSHATHEIAPSKIVQLEQVFLCEGCEREFGTVQALSAHKRFCATVLASNNGSH